MAGFRSSHPVAEIANAVKLDESELKVLSPAVIRNATFLRFEMESLALFFSLLPLLLIVMKLGKSFLFNRAHSLFI